MATTETAQGLVTTVVMVYNGGGALPTVINTNYSGNVYPAPNGTITVDSRDANSLIEAGWMFQVASGAPAIP